MQSDLVFCKVFRFTGIVEEFICPISGVYKFSVFGAQGGNSMINSVVQTGGGGKGGAAYGYYFLKRDQSLFVCVGGAGSDGKFGGAEGGYNGGGRGLSDTNPNDFNGPESGGAGGGASHIATKNRGVLSNYENYKNEILIVAGGGGGKVWDFQPGDGGGATGGYTDRTSQKFPTQTEGFAFGRGEDGYVTDETREMDGVAGGGGGWYGGYSNGVLHKTSGTGGSGYIGGVPTFTYDGKEYQPLMSNKGEQIGNGQVMIELIKAEPGKPVKCVCSCGNFVRRFIHFKSLFVLFALC